MKKLSLILLVVLVTIISCSKSNKNKYAFLNGVQLKQLGVIVSDQGVFYKNRIPNYQEMKERYPYLGFYCTNDIYLNSIFYKETDTLTAVNKIDSLFISLPTTNFDFYPILIGNTRGEFSLKRNFNNERLFPVAVCMAETGLPKRSDTLIIWFKPSASLQTVLPSDIKVENYIMVPTIKE
jgi:hypothetical protein